MVEPAPFQGAWVRQHRELLGLTQEDLADAVRADGGRLSRSHLANIEAGLYAAPPDLVRVVAAMRGLEIRDAWRHVGTLARSRRVLGPTLHRLSHVGDAGDAPPSVEAGGHSPPTPPSPHASAMQLLDWARTTLVSLAVTDSPHGVVLTTTGPLAEALRVAPPPDGILGGILGRGIHAVLDSGGELCHVLAVPDDPEAHLEVLAEALPLAARYCLPPSRSRPYLSRYDLTLSSGPPTGPDLVASTRSGIASMLVPVISDGEPGYAVLDAAPPASAPADENYARWPRDHASWLAARGTQLFSWVTVLPAGTLSMPFAPWEERLTRAWELPGGRDSFQRMLPLNTMSYDLRSQLVAAQARRQGQTPGSVTKEVRHRLSMYRARRAAMIRNLENGYSYRNIVTREALNDLVEHGQYTIERLPDNVLTRGQASDFLQAAIELARSFPNFEVLVLTDSQLEQALPLGVSWIVKRSAHSQATSPGPAWAFLPYILNGEHMAMNVIVNDALAVEGISRRIDALWDTWAEGRTREQIRQEALAELGHTQSRT
jgi:transcriptional regulator with XRE-family HTH domain